MAKKIYDIKPPKMAKKETKKAVVKKTKASVSTTKSAKPKINTYTNKTEMPQEKWPLWIPITAVSSILVVILCVFLFFTLQKAEITIWPKVDVYSYEQTITADKTAELVDIENKIIPAHYIEAEKTNSQEFPSTGTASNEGKASGTITVYNKCDPATPVTLSKGAHFLSDSGKSFAYLKPIVIPAATKKNGKTIPGSVDLPAEADGTGDDYNIAPAAFSIPKLSGTIYYSCIYGTSEEDMIGGYTGKVKKITEDDIFEAEKVLTEKTEVEAAEMLEAQISEEYIMIDDATIMDVSDGDNKARAGVIADNFNYQITITARALVVKKSDLEEYVKNYILSMTEEESTILEESLQIDYSAGSVDISEGIITLNVDFSSGVYNSIDKNSISLSLLGQNKAQVENTIGNVLGEEVTKSEIKFWPFWVKHAPNNQEKINIKLEF